MKGLTAAGVAMLASSPKQPTSNADQIEIIRRLVPEFGSAETANKLCRSQTYIGMLWCIAQYCPQEWIDNEDLGILELHALSKLIKRGYSIDITTGECKITVNGRPVTVKKNSISYEGLLAVAECSPGASVTYRKSLGGDVSRNGLLSKGQSVGDISGMIFSVVHTGGA
jgi:hypothetical protein